VKSGEVRLRDAENAALSPASRFDLACNAAHAICLAALHRHGYRSDNVPSAMILPPTDATPFELSARVSDNRSTP
jgi:hypothetical protein